MQNYPVMLQNAARNIAISICLVLMIGGCKMLHRQSAVVVQAKPVVKKVAVQSLNLALVQPNEAGKVPIVMYHEFVTGSKPKDLECPIAIFKKDLQWMYDHHYRPISLTDYVNGKIDCPIGTSPIILTFDDARKTQFAYTSDGRIDPNCAVGILEAFHAQHADWPLKGTFFVLTGQPPAFYQYNDTEQSKMDYLVKDGFEIGNHTIHHWKSNHLSDAQFQSELAGAAANISKILPGYNVQTFALPYGTLPKNHKLLMSGKSGNLSYHNICSLLAAWRPAPSPMDKKFNPYRIERVEPGDKLDQLEWWLKQIEKNKADKFVSDGDPSTYTVSLLQKGVLDQNRLKKANFHLRVYSGSKVISQT